MSQTPEELIERAKRLLSNVDATYYKAQSEAVISQFIEALTKERSDHADTVNTLHKVIDHGLPRGMLEGSHEFKLLKEIDELRAELDYVRNGGKL